MTDIRLHTNVGNRIFDRCHVSLSTMETLARNENVSAWWDVPDGIDHRSVSSNDIYRYERIKQETNVDDDLLTELRKRRLAAQETDYTLSQDHHL
jgi:hypothetical protein